MSFRNSCAIINYPCNVGDTYINPCSCYTYLQCVHGRDVIRRPCSQGTVWDHVEQNCLSINEVVVDKERCNLTNPWRRCRTVTGSQTPATLMKICSSSTNDDAGNGNDEGDGGGGGGGGGNAGAVVGGVLGGLLLLLVIGVIIYVIVKKKSLPEWFRSIREKYKTNRGDAQNETVEEVYDVIDEKQVSSSPPIDNPGYKKESKPHGIIHNNTGASNQHSSTQGGASGSDNMPYSTLKPDDYDDLDRSYSSLRPTREEDLSRSISVNGKDLAVQDTQGYFIGYPSGTVPRQPSPIPTNVQDDIDHGYSLGKALEPDVQSQQFSRLPSEYFVLQKVDAEQNE